MVFINVKAKSDRCNKLINRLDGLKSEAIMLSNKLNKAFMSMRLKQFYRNYHGSISISIKNLSLPSLLNQYGGCSSVG